jgi:prepilin-type N-terminal cleavage/methylation domain-containing protein
MKEKNVKKAFTLIELSIVILIVSVLISGGLQVSINVMNNAKIKATKDRMSEIYKALGNFALANKRLPCPASITDLKSSSSSYGNEGSCVSASSSGGIYFSSLASNLNYGMVPVKALGLSLDMAEDGFSNKFAYVIDKRFAASDGTAFSSYGSITIKENQGGSDQAVIPVPLGSLLTPNNQIQNNDGGIFAIISYGQNQYGAFPSNSANMNSRSSDTAEMDNDLGTTTSPSFDNIFFSVAKNSDSFDDMVFYKSRNLFLLDFNALFLVKCPNSTTTPTPTNSGDVANCAGPCAWPETYYNQIAISTTLCAYGYTSTVKYPTKRCGAFGVWQAGAINPCTQ